MSIKKRKNKLVNNFVIITFVSLYICVSIISTIHVIEFFRLTNTNWLAISLAIAFEIGAAASLSSIIIMKRLKIWIVFGLFGILTAMQMMGNTYYAFTHLDKFQSWIELFGLQERDLIFQKRILAIISGAILPVIALGFIKSLVDYLNPYNKEESIAEKIAEEYEYDEITGETKLVEKKQETKTDEIESSIIEDKKKVENLDKNNNITKPIEFNEKSTDVDVIIDKEKQKNIKEQNKRRSIKVQNGIPLNKRSDIKLSDYKNVNGIEFKDKNYKPLLDKYNIKPSPEAEFENDIKVFGKPLTKEGIQMDKAEEDNLESLIAVGDTKNTVRVQKPPQQEKK